MGRRGDWVPTPGYGSSFTSSIGVPIDVILVSPRDENASALGEVGVVETQNEVLVHRVVGTIDMQLSSGASDNTLVVERIRVGLLDDAGAAAFYADDFLSASEANEPFLWQRVSRLDAGQNANNVVTHPYWSTIDLRVKRKLTRDQALFYSVQSFNADGVLQVVPMLRSWCTVLT